jgi:hypothetical protein
LCDSPWPLGNQQPPALRREFVPRCQGAAQPSAQGYPFPRGRFSGLVVRSLLRQRRHNRRTGYHRYKTQRDQKIMHGINSFSVPCVFNAKIVTRNSNRKTRVTHHFEHCGNPFRVTTLHFLTEYSIEISRLPGVNTGQIEVYVSH